MNQQTTPATIQDADGLARLCERLTGVEAIGLDTEFLRERTYFAQLCLLQLSADSDAWCIDTLAQRDLGALRAPLNGAAPIKVLHAARQDLEVLWPATGALTGLFDTQVAAALIGMPAQIGYGDLVHRLLSITLHKGQTRTDWSRRPLSAAQLGRWEWFQQEMSELDAIGSFDADPQQAWRRFKGFAELDQDRQRLAVGLTAWREQRAISADRPRNWILPDAALRDIVLRAPRTQHELADTPELAEGTLNHSGAQILAIVDAARLPQRLAPLPQRQRPDPATLAVVRKLSELAQQVGRELGLAPELLATRRDLERLVAGARDGDLLKGWRRAVIGERLLAAL